MEKTQVMTVKQISEKLGVSKQTVKNYQKKGLIPDRRSPANNYRIFTSDDLEALKKAVYGNVAQ